MSTQGQDLSLLGADITLSTGHLHIASRKHPQDALILADDIHSHPVAAASLMTECANRFLAGLDAERRAPRSRRVDVRWGLVSSGRPRVLIADDHRLIAELYKSLLETEFDVVGIAGDGRALVRAASKLKADLILLDISMPVLDGLQAAQQLKRLLPSVKLIFVTMNSDEMLAAEAFRRGASAYLPTTCGSSELLAAFRVVWHGGSYLSPTLCKDRVNYLRSTQTNFVPTEQRLTKRELEVLRLIAEGKDMNEIADALSIGPRTVAFHKYRIWERLGVTSDAEIVRYAVKTGLIS